MTELTRRFFPQRMLKPTSPTVPDAVKDAAPTAIGFIPVYETFAQVREMYPRSEVSIFNEVSNDAHADASLR
jgi:hypothetical protein